MNETENWVVGSIRQAVYSTKEMSYACVSGTRGDPCRPEMPWKWDR